MYNQSRSASSHWSSLFFTYLLRITGVSNHLYTSSVLDYYLLFHNQGWAVKAAGGLSIQYSLFNPRSCDR